MKRGHFPPTLKLDADEILVVKSGRVTKKKDNAGAKIKSEVTVEEEDELLMDGAGGDADAAVNNGEGGNDLDEFM
jgi:hypothetical protein